MSWFIKGLKQYADFNGRAHRTEFWMYMFIVLIIQVVLTVLESSIGLFGVLSTIFSLAVFVPTIAVTARRLHDTGRSGWWQLIGFIPLIGLIVMIIFCIKDSDPGANAFGDNPKGIAA